MKYFKVKIGYNVDDFITINENELPMAIRAQITGKVGVFETGSIAGNLILSITPDWNKVMGWNRDYKLNEEDYDYIGKKMVEDYRIFTQHVIGNVNRQLNGLQPIEKFERPKEIEDEVKKLSDKFKINY